MSNELKTTEEKPSFLSTQKLGLENIHQFLRPARLKIVQPMAGEQFQAFTAGDCVVVPAMQEIPQPFRFTPIFFFPQWCLHNPIAMKGQLPFIRQFTLDANDPLAKMCQNPATRVQPCPENPATQCEAHEHLNFVIIVEGMPDMPILCSFFKGEHKSGSTLLQMAKMRDADIFASIFEAKTSQRNNTKGRWWGLDFTNPATNQWVGQGAYEHYKDLHLLYAKGHAEKLLVADLDDEPISTLAG